MEHRLSHQDATKVGLVAELMATTDRYGGMSVAGLVRTLLPPIQLNQCVFMWNEEGKLVGFASWAFFSPEVEQVFVTRSRKLQFDDWKSGPVLWAYDFIAPGHALELVRVVREVISKRYPFVEVGKFHRNTLAGKTRRAGFVHRLKSEVANAPV